MSLRRAAFVDRDGVINALTADPVTGRPESPLRVEDVALLPGVAAALTGLAGGGWLLVGVSNQPSAAKGFVSVAAIEAVQNRVLSLLRDEGVEFDAFELCLHHPDGIVPELTGRCDCRKPAPGMLLAAAGRLAIELGSSWMIGDTDGDMLAGRAAGCRTILVTHEPSAHKRGGAQADLLVPDLAAAAAALLANNAR